MESKASYLLVGSFVLVAIAALFGFVLWMAGDRDGDEAAYYDIYFEESVAGLALGGDVRYRGIRIGTVTDIRVPPDDPSRVLVRVEVDKTTAIRQGDRASLQLQGITGVSFVNIEGANAQDPLLAVQANQEYARIPAETSQIGAVLAGAPALLANGNELLSRLNTLVDSENQQRFDTILSDLQVLSGAMASLSTTVDDRFANLADQASTTMQDVSAASNRIERLLSAFTSDSDDDSFSFGMSGLTESLSSAAKSFDHVPTLIQGLGNAGESISVAAEQVRLMMADNRQSLSEFITDGLPEFYRFITEARQLVSGLTRITDQLEKDGAGFLFRGSERGYEVER